MKATVIPMDPRAVRVTFEGGRFTVELVDGRAVSVPLHWSPRLTRATAKLRNGYALVADGEIIRWPDVDEDILVVGLLAADEIVVPPDGDLSAAAVERAHTGRR